MKKKKLIIAVVIICCVILYIWQTNKIHNTPKGYCGINRKQCNDAAGRNNNSGNSTNISRNNDGARYRRIL